MLADTGLRTVQHCTLLYARALGNLVHEQADNDWVAEQRAKFVDRNETIRFSTTALAHTLDMSPKFFLKEPLLL